MTALLASSTTWLDHPAVLYGLLPAAGYLFGATPFAYLLARARGVDLRKVGSGNIGATNLGRACGRSWGFLCFFLDLAKGLVPVLAVGLMLRNQPGFPKVSHQAAWLATGCGCILGHVFPIWLKFRGGKGVATSLGVVLGVWPYFTLAGLGALGIWIVVTLVSRYVSLGSVVAAIAFLPLFLAINGLVIGFSETLDFWPMMVFAGAMVLLIIVRHRSNIVRLARGTENRIGGAESGKSTEAA